MPEPRKGFTDIYAELKAKARAEWETSGSTLSFEEWRRQKIDKQLAEEEARRQAEARAEALERRRAALANQTPARYRDAQTDEPKIVQWVEQLLAWSRQLRPVAPSDPRVEGWFAEPPKNPLDPDLDADTAGPCLLVLGPTGVGKTYAAYAALRRYVEAGGKASIKAVTVADLYAELRPRPGVDSEEVFSGYAKAPVLFIDDLGAAKSSEWTEEVNYRLTNYRWNHQLATLITSNVPPKQLGEYLGDRVASRLTGMCTTVALKGQDRRRAA